ncbi:terminase [Paenarthrobacter sp. YIM B13468]|uniref:terminase n=1 Tax=Paenarthrobacter sp. YIM B13468 TaxID=3366295 RepID=UPI00366EDCE8
MINEIPAHLGAAGRSLYVAAVEEFELSLPELAALLQAAETIDTLRIIEDEIRKTGPVLPTGKPSPLLSEARQQRAILVRLLGLLDLRLDEEEAPGENGVRPSVSRAARKAARARWSK